MYWRDSWRSKVDDHSAIQIILDVGQKNLSKFVVGNLSVAVAVGVDHCLVHDLLKLRLLINKINKIEILSCS